MKIEDKLSGCQTRECKVTLGCKLPMYFIL